MQVTFVETPAVGQRAAFIANGQSMTSSPVTRVDTDPAQPGWFSVYTSSGSNYSGLLHLDYQPTTYAYTPPPPVSASVQVQIGPLTGTGHSVPPEIVCELNWGAFLLALFWSIAHNVWIGLLCLVPGVGLIMPFVLLFKGNELAWQSRQFVSVAQFREVQRKWIIAGNRLLLECLCDCGLFRAGGVADCRNDTPHVHHLERP